MTPEEKDGQGCIECNDPNGIIYAHTHLCLCVCVCMCMYIYLTPTKY